MADTAVQAITHRRVLSISIPIVVANATVPLLGLVDTGVVGQMGEAAPIGAVGIGAIILSAIYWLFGFLRMGTTGLTSQAIGAGQNREESALLSRALLIGGLIGLTVIALQKPIFWAGFQLAPASDEVEALARDYLVVRVWGAPALIALYGINGWLIAKECTGSVLLLQLVMNGINILLDLWFVLGLGWGVQGVALATLIAEWGGLCLGLWLCVSGFKSGAWRDRSLVFDQVRLRLMLVINRDILFRSLFIEIIFVSFLFAGARFGDVTLAANQILLQFLHVTSYMLDGFAQAAETLVGKAVGRSDKSRLRRGALLASLWGGVMTLALCLFFALLGGPLIDLMAKAPEVQADARAFLIYAAIAPALGLAPYMLDGVFIGATRTRDMRNMMALSLLVYVVFALLLVPSFANHGLWMALMISFLARTITMALRYPALERDLF
ncbi:MAG: MATE family efflux transporter [Pseudomonadota bacterium]